MIVVISTQTGDVRVAGSDDLESLSVQLDDSTQPVTGSARDLASIEDGHAWLDITALRDACQSEPTADWLAAFEGMIGYARSQGWVSEDGRSVRAHIEEWS